MKFAALLFTALLLFALGANAQTTNAVSDAEIEGQQLAQQILQDTPTTNFSEKAVIKIRDSKRVTKDVSIDFSTKLESNGWSVFYNKLPTIEDHSDFSLLIRHFYGRTDIKYLFLEGGLDKGRMSVYTNLDETQIWVPFADSDFWIADLGLEFFHWPDQKIIKHETRRTRACAVLESTNPNPTPGAYSRVDSWIDNETLGVVHAEAFDANGKLLKVFDPKSFKKVNGQWELQDMDIRNVQTGSRTRIEFDLKTNSGGIS